MNSLDTSAIQLVSIPNDEAQMDVDEEGKPRFAPARDIGSVARIESRKVPIPPHRMSPLKSTWPKIYPVVVEHLNLAIRMNVKSKAVELRTTRKTTDTGALQKGADFITAFALGFDVDDAIALLRLDDLYIETFEIKDVKTLEGDHKGKLYSRLDALAQPKGTIRKLQSLIYFYLARAIGRIAGQSGKTKYAIENASKTRIVLADSKVHILGGFKNIQIARTSIVSLIMGKQPGKVYNGLRTVAARMKERF
ncbi:pre-rRNA-processing protein PNO1 [Apiospora saccharicola]|uniref:Pre-rRNA-processing protein PNO1 n=1 Tax=Apiospora saccharicola TaxID=335842 RepID=A0ABR1WH64_9PEZI